MIPTLLFLACGGTPSTGVDETPPGGTDTADSGTIDTAPPEDTADTEDTDDPSGVHYMCETDLQFTPAGGSAVACAGEAHINVNDDGSVIGVAGCDDGGDIEMGGPVRGTVEDGVFDVTWAMRLGDDEGEASILGTVDPDSLEATLEGEASWGSITGVVTGYGIPF